MPIPAGAPANVAKPSGAGTKITTLPWAGFKGAISYSFDDNNASLISSYSKLNALGVHFTYELWTGQPSASDPIWATALMDGHELANHTQSHVSSASASDINAATQFITDKFKTPPFSMAAPYGDGSYPPVADGLFFINRMISNGLIAPNDNTDPLKLPTAIPPTGGEITSGDNQFIYKDQVDGAVSANKWRTFCVHGFTGDADAYQAVDLDGFIAGVVYAKGQGAWIDTITAVGSYWQGEKAFNAATSMTAGADKNFTWKLPAKFPPGRYIRVTTDGGTLKQGGTALAWDPHGYYEIALDALSVTLSP